MTFPELYKYRITKKIDKKQCYTRYEAVDQIEENLVHLKVLDKELSKNENNVIYFLNSARMLKLFNNPNIYKVYDYGSDQGNHYVATEPVEWEPISSLIKDTFSLSFQDLVEIFNRISSTLRYAHLKGLIHGFLNPKCIFINSDGAIKIDDFGFDWYVNDTLTNENRDSLYLTQYISPEIYDTKGQIDGRVDIYSMGVIMFHMVNGFPPFTGKTIADIKKQHLNAQLPEMKLSEHDLPLGLESIILRAMNKKKESRFQNLKEFNDSIKTLKRNFSNTSETSGPISPTEPDLNLEPYKSQHYYFEDRPESDNNNGYKSTFQSQSFINIVGSILTSRKFAFSAVSILILVTILFIGSNQIPILFQGNSLPDNDSTEIKANTNPVTQISEMLPEENINQEEQPFVKEEDTVAELDTTTTPLIAGNNHKDAEEPSNTEAEIKPEKSTEAKTDIATNNENVTNKIKTTKKAPAKPTDVSPPIRTASTKFLVKSENKPIEAAIFIDNKFKGKTDRNGQILITQLEINKSYKAKISKEGFEAITRDFSVTDNSSVFNFTINPKLDIFGTLVLDAQPKADSIFVDGKHRIGKAPLELTLPWGEHRIRYVNNSLNKSWEQVVDLKVGQILRVKHDFERSEFGKVAVSLKNAANFGFGYVYVDGKLWDGKPNTTPLEINLPIGSHTIEVRRQGFNSIPKDIIVVIELGATKYVSFTFSKAR